jgi:hypothetical protein
LLAPQLQLCLLLQVLPLLALALAQLLLAPRLLLLPLPLLLLGQRPRCRLAEDLSTQAWRVWHHHPHRCAARASWRGDGDAAGWRASEWHCKADGTATLPPTHLAKCRLPQHRHTPRPQHGPDVVWGDAICTNQLQTAHWQLPVPCCQPDLAAWHLNSASLRVQQRVQACIIRDNEPEGHESLQRCQLRVVRPRYWPGERPRLQGVDAEALHVPQCLTLLLKLLCPLLAVKPTLHLQDWLLILCHNWCGIQVQHIWQPAGITLVSLQPPAQCSCLLQVLLSLLP